MRNILELSLEQLAEVMRKLDRVYKEQATDAYRHHEMAAATVQLWKHQADDMLIMLKGVEKHGE